MTSVSAHGGLVHVVMSVASLTAHTKFNLKTLNSEKKFFFQAHRHLLMHTLNYVEC